MIGTPRDEALKALIAEFEAMTGNVERAEKAMELVDMALEWGTSRGIAAGLDAAMRTMSGNGGNDGNDKMTVTYIQLDPDDPLAEHLRSVTEAEAAGSDDDE